MGADTTTLTPVHRVVTGHNEAGQAVVISNATFTGVPVPSGASVHTTIWTSSGTPIDNNDTIDGRDRNPDITLPGGSIIRVIDLLPGTTAPMHRTSSLDYGIVLSGQIELLLDDRSSTLVEAGGIVIQRGTIHSWRNPSKDVTTRMAFVLLDAKPVTIDGVPLADVHPRVGVIPDF